MADGAKILIFAGSARKGALSKKVANAARIVVADKGARPTLIDLSDFEAPIYNGDLEEAEGVPESMRKLNGLIRAHDGLILVTPEYNGFFTPLMKNVLDWCSRSGASDENPPLPRGKPAAILGSAPGVRGGIRAIPRLRDYLSELGMVVAPFPAAVGNAGDAFDADGRFSNEQQAAMVGGAIDALLALTDLPT